MENNVPRPGAETAGAVAPGATGGKKQNFPGGMKAARFWADFFDSTPEAIVMAFGEVLP